VIAVGAGLSIFHEVARTSTAYVSNLIPLSNWIGREDETFYHGWTVFYWAWWISWSPFVGMFIAGSPAVAQCASSSPRCC